MIADVDQYVDAAYKGIEIIGQGTLNNTDAAGNLLASQVYATLAIAAAIEHQTRVLIRIHNAQPADGGTYISEEDI